MEGEHRSALSTHSSIQLRVAASASEVYTIRFAIEDCARVISPRFDRWRPDVPPYLSTTATRKRTRTDLDVLDTLLRHGCIYVSRVRKVYSISADLRHSDIGILASAFHCHRLCLLADGVRYFITAT